MCQYIAIHLSATVASQKSSVSPQQTCLHLSIHPFTTFKQPYHNDIRPTMYRSKPCTEMGMYRSGHCTEIHLMYRSSPCTEKNCTEVVCTEMDMYRTGPTPNHPPYVPTLPVNILNFILLITFCAYHFRFPQIFDKF